MKKAFKLFDQKKILILLLFSLLFLTGCEMTTSTTTTITRTTVTYLDVLDYQDFEEYIILEVSDQLSMPESVYYLYFYQLTCTHCNDIKQQVLHTIKDLEFNKVYLVESPSFSDIHPDISVTYTPSLVKVVLGEEVEIYVGPDDVIDFIITLN